MLTSRVDVYAQANGKASLQTSVQSNLLQKPHRRLPPPCHPSRQRMLLSAACARKADKCKQPSHGTLQRDGICQPRPKKLRLPLGSGFWSPSFNYKVHRTHTPVCHLPPPNCISISSAVFAQLTYVPNRHRHRENTLRARVRHNRRHLGTACG